MCSEGVSFCLLRRADLVWVCRSVVAPILLPYLYATAAYWLVRCFFCCEDIPSYNFWAVTTTLFVDSAVFMFYGTDLLGRLVGIHDLIFSRKRRVKSAFPSFSKLVVSFEDEKRGGSSYLPWKAVLSVISVYFMTAALFMTVFLESYGIRCHIKYYYEIRQNLSSMMPCGGHFIFEAGSKDFICYSVVAVAIFTAMLVKYYREKYMSQYVVF